MLRIAPGLLVTACALGLISCYTPLGDVVDANRDAAMAAPALSASTSQASGGGAEPAISSRLPVSWDFGLPIVQTTIDGRGPFRFVLDSGAYSYVCIDRRLAEKLGLEHADTSDLFGRSASLPDPGGGRLSVRETVSVKEVRAGTLVLHDAAALVIDLAEIRRAGADFDGILPASLFRKGLLTFEPERGAVTYAAGVLPPADGQHVFEYANADEPSLTIEVDGSSRRVLIDTGGGCFLTWPVASEKTTRFVRPPALVGASMTLADKTPRREGRLQGTIVFGGCPLVEPIVDLGALESAWAGMDLLRRFHMTFDFANRRVRFERADAEPIRSPPVRSAGAGFVHGGRAWTINFLAEGSPAAAAGLHVGDRVDAIDGRPVSELGVVGYRKILDSHDSVTLHVLGEGTGRDVTLAIKTLVE